jgi:hypothetical protein
VVNPARGTITTTISRTRRTTITILTHPTTPFPQILKLGRLCEPGSTKHEFEEVACIPLHMWNTKQAELIKSGIIRWMHDKLSP